MADVYDPRLQNTRKVTNVLCTKRSAPWAPNASRGAKARSLIMRIAREEQLLQLKNVHVSGGRGPRDTCLCDVNVGGGARRTCRDCSADASEFPASRFSRYFVPEGGAAPKGLETLTGARALQSREKFATALQYLELCPRNSRYSKIVSAIQHSSLLLRFLSRRGVY